MCFSANASFITGAVLATAAVITLRSVKSREQVLFAAIPLIFCIQQITEGFVWLSLTDPGNKIWSHIPVTAFLFFAHIVWPVWVPLAVLVMEKDYRRRKILKSMLATGIIVSAYLGVCLFFRPVNAMIRDHHIFYELEFPSVIKWISAVFYFIPTVMPPFVSSRRNMSWLGMSVLASYIVSQVFFEGYVISVWCFFAAIISVAVLLIIRYMPGNKKAGGELSGA